MKPTLPSNVTYELRPAMDSYRVLDAPDRSLDFAVVDGASRAACVRKAIRKVKNGGYVDLDNSDKTSPAVAMCVTPKPRCCQRLLRQLITPA